MIELKSKEISKILGCRLKKIINAKINKVSTDSRTIDENTVFFALKGEKFDGHDFVKEVVDKGAPLVVVSRKIEGVDRSRQIIVKNTLKALGKLAQYNRLQYKGVVIAVTGSAGKTTTKEELKQALSCYGKTYATTGNYNNFVGVPLTLLNLDMDSQFAIVEMGMSARGEIKYLANLTNPDIAVVTNVYPMHLEFLGTLKNIAKAKAEIFTALDKKATAIFNADTAYADILFKAAIKNTKKIITFSKENHLGINLDNKSEAMQHNAWCVLSVLNALKLDIEVAKNLIEDFDALEGRGKKFSLKINDKKITLIDDSYSGQPEAMKLAIKELAKYKGRKIALLGKMAELGDYTLKAHQEVGELLRECHIDVVIGVCEETKDMLKELDKSTEQYYFENSDNIATFLKEKILKDGDVILIKGAHYSSKVYLVSNELKTYAV